ncbi:MAG: class I SAM-dependent methyltransferase [Deltaproteobacteria bacterium]|nr:class I SAM-dependent methyltransferase [Deltaproteobacteria bacterium]
MAWDEVWEAVFQEQEWGRYPPEELIRFVARSFYNVARRDDVRLLEIGCGPGANVWFMAREGFDVFGVDASNTAIRLTRERLEGEGLRANLAVGDIKELDRIFPGLTFDAVIDVCCIQCHQLADAEAILQQIHSVLKPGGRSFNMLLAAGTYGEGLGRKVEPGTFEGIAEGPLAGRGVNHFFSLDEVKRLMRPFSDVQIDSSKRSLNGLTWWINHWIVQGVKGH